MRNIIGQFKNSILCQYDLKGSVINRKANFEFDTIQKIVMKDLNFEEIEKRLLLRKIDMERLRNNCKSDSFFLADLDIMDYSLFVVKVCLNNKEIDQLFGTSYIESGFRLNRESLNNFLTVDYYVNERNSIFENVEELEPYKKYLYRSLNKNIVYIISIIDYFQIYNFYKYLETNIKYYLKERPRNIEDISCVAPDIYSKRFIEYVEKVTNLSEIIDDSLFDCE